MIVSKPKIGTLFSLGTFIVLCLLLAGWALLTMQGKSNYTWYQYGAVIFFAPLGLGLLLRTIFSYKIVRIGKGEITVSFPTRFNSKAYKLNNIIHWGEQDIKTAGGKYMEMQILFDDKKKLYLSMQEHTNYSKVIQYLKKKCSKKFKT